MMMMMMTTTFHLCLVFFIFLCLFSRDVDCFNLDTKVAISKSGPRGSYFGFSVAFHKVENKDNTVLVGAPKSDNDYGQIYKCLVTANKCVNVNVHPPKEKKQIQWLGVSVSSQNAIDGYALACSHRANKTIRLEKGTHSAFKGLCFLFGNDLTWELPLEPCDTCSFCQKSDYADCQIGTSSYLDSSGNILIGGPGFYDGTGMIFKSINETATYKEGRAGSLKYSYLGASVKSGRLLADKQLAYAAGAPNMNVFGKVVLMTENLLDRLEFSEKLVLTGDQPFSSFGYEMAVGDFNNDGYDDLVVGAPFYYESHTTGGAIYVYTNGPQGITSITKPLKILSRRMKESECQKLKCHDARFGFSLGSVGDLDGDGYPDLVVGAPFEGNGAIYIFPGSDASLKPEYTQRIVASDVRTNPVGGNLPSFGYSLSQGPYDIDENSYPDVAVGWYTQDMVVLLRTRPVVNSVFRLYGSVSNLNPKEPSCSARDAKQNQSCFDVTVCFKFTLKPQQRFKNTLDMKYALALEKISGPMERASFTAENVALNASKTLSMRAQSEDQFVCYNHTVYILPSNRDWLNPIIISLSYNLTNLRIVDPNTKSIMPSLDTYPILNASLAKTQPNLRVDFMKDCGEDDKCNCDLKLVANSAMLTRNNEGKLEVKVSQKLQVDVNITNTGEDAHQTMLYIHHPSNVVFVGTETALPALEVHCDPVGQETVACDVANPLAMSENIFFFVKFNLKKLSMDEEIFQISMVTNSTSHETNPTDNEVVLYFEVLTESDLSVVSRTNPTTIFYSHQEEGMLSPVLKRVRDVEEIGPELEHIFEVKNVGKSEFPSSTVVINWPRSLMGGYPLFYIVSEPEVLSAGGYCNADKSLINPHNLTIRKNLESQRLNIPSTEQLIRETREVLEMETTSSPRDLRCSSDKLKCKSFNCVINPLKPGESSVVRVYSRFWNRTFQKVFPKEMEVAIYVEARLQLPANVKQVSLENDFHETKTLLLRDERDEQKAPIWIYLVAALIGLLLLILVILILWKLGFFKRKTHDSLQQYSVIVTKKEQNEVDKK